MKYLIYTAVAVVFNNAIACALSTLGYFLVKIAALIAALPEVF
jgi:hypothetical protein